MAGSVSNATELTIHHFVLSSGTCNRFFLCNRLYAVSTDCIVFTLGAVLYLRQDFSTAKPRKWKLFVSYVEGLSEVKL